MDTPSFITPLWRWVSKSKSRAAATFQKRTALFQLNVQVFLALDPAAGKGGFDPKCGTG
jgi:hypothetical protein